LAATQPVRKALDDLLRRLNLRPEVKIASVYYPQMHPSTDFGVSAELHNGAVIDFWIDLFFETTTWQMEFSVLRHNPDEDGSHCEQDFPAESIASVSDLPNRLLAAIEKLAKASDMEQLFR
jgi:hypothetical protein